MPYGVAVFGLSRYGQLELPLFERVGGLLRYSETSTTLGLVRAGHPTPFSMIATEYVAPFSLNRQESETVPLRVQRSSGVQTDFALSRTSPATQLQLLRTSSEGFSKILLVRNWSDFTES